MKWHAWFNNENVEIILIFAISILTTFTVRLQKHQVSLVLTIIVYIKFFWHI